MITLNLLDVESPSVGVIFAAFCLTNPIFVYSMQTFFSNDGQASIFIRVFYFAFGAVGPIAM